MRCTNQWDFKGRDRRIHEAGIVPVVFNLPEFLNIPHYRGAYRAL